MAASNPPEPFLEVEFEEATKYVRGKVAATGSQEDLLYLYARCVMMMQPVFKTKIAGSSKQRKESAQWPSPLSTSSLRNQSGTPGKSFLAWGELKL